MRFEVLLGILLFVSVGAVSSCAQNAKQVPPPTSREESKRRDAKPADVFKEYWENARTGDADGLKNLIAEPPDYYFECKLLTYQECLAERSKAKPPVSRGEDEAELAIEPDRLIHEIVPNWIREGTWISYVVEREDISGDHARLTVKINAKHAIYHRHILLMEMAGTWKLIAIVEPGEVEGFVEPGTKA